MRDVGRKGNDSRPEFGPPRLDQAIAARARRQHGVVSREQLQALGVEPRGRLTPLGGGAGEHLTRSDLEIRFKDLCRQPGLPEPRVNQPVAGKQVDFRQRALPQDPPRLRGRPRPRRPHHHTGYRTLRLTDRQLTRHPHHVANAIAAVLAAGPAQDSHE